MTITDEPTDVPGTSWDVLAKDLPPTRQAWLKALETLSEAGAHEAVDEGYRQLLAQDPSDKKAAFRYAAAATDRRDWAEAALRWQAVHEAEPTNKIAIHCLSEAWIRLGNLKAADAILEKGLKPLRGGDLAATDKLIRRMMINYARLAVRQADWPRARLRWKVLFKQLPNDPIVRAGYHRAWGLPQDAPAAGQITGDAVMSLQQWSQLEGLGSRCEFGLVQRHFGAEPLGLFRWVSLGPSKLCRALRTDLAGIGDDEFTEVEVNENGEFSTTDSRYGLAMHSFIKDIGQDRDVLFRQLKRRMVFLRRKLLEDLASGEKLFVYRSAETLEEETVLRISTELKRFHPANALLAVAGESPDEPAIDPYLIAPDTLFATIPDGRKIPFGSGWDIKFERWAEVCAVALKTLKPVEPAREE